MPHWRTRYAKTNGWAGFVAMALAAAVCVFIASYFGLSK